MGLTFRDGNYIRFVRLGGRTIKDGEAAAIWSRDGVHTQIVGPKRVILLYSTIRFLTRFKAEAHQYLEIKHRDGKVEHLPGPISMYHNPTWHDAINVRNGIHLTSSNETIMVSSTPIRERQNVRGDGKDSHEETSMVVSRGRHEIRFVNGPTIFLPAANERVCKFTWTVPSLDINKACTETFSVIQLNMRKLWNVQVPLITSDFVKFRVTLAIAYKLVSVSKCTTVVDPVASLTSALMADGKALGSRISGDELKKNTEETSLIFSLTDSYSTLVETGQNCGIDIESIHFQSIMLDDATQKQIDDEQQRRLGVARDLAAREDSLRLQSLDLERQQKATENRIELSRKEAKLQADLAEETFIQKKEEILRAEEIETKKQEIKLSSMRKDDELVLSFLQHLKALGVDMSEFMCSNGGRNLTSNVLGRAPSLRAIPKDSKQRDGNDAKSVPFGFESGEATWSDWKGR